MKFRSHLTARHLDVVRAREKMIESLGDYMCGSGTGPSIDEVRNFERLEQKETLARKRLSEFVHRLTFEIKADNNKGF